jgi:hypothetical protein
MRRCHGRGLDERTRVPRRNPSSRLRSDRSPRWPRLERRTRTSVPRSSSAPPPSTTTSERCSGSCRSRHGATSLGRSARARRPGPDASSRLARASSATDRAAPTGRPPPFTALGGSFPWRGPDRSELRPGGCSTARLWLRRSSTGSGTRRLDGTDTHCRASLSALIRTCATWSSAMTFGFSGVTFGTSPGWRVSVTNDRLPLPTKSESSTADPVSGSVGALTNR